MSLRLLRWGSDALLRRVLFRRSFPHLAHCGRGSILFYSLLKLDHFNVFALIRLYSRLLNGLIFLDIDLNLIKLSQVSLLFSIFVMNFDTFFFCLLVSGSNKLLLSLKISIFLHIDV